MNAYVGVTNDVSLAVKSILQVKKAFRKQMKCMEDLSNTNISLKQKILQLEKKNEDLAKKILQLESEREKQDLIVSDLFCGVDNFDLVNKVFDSVHHASSARVNRHDSGVNTNHKHKDEHLCPASPVASNKQGCKRKVTPKKKTVPRKSRRLSNREQKNQSISA